MTKVITYYLYILSLCHCDRRTILVYDNILYIYVFYSNELYSILEYFL